MVSGGRVVVSIHDVAPSQAADVRFLLDALDDLGARPRVLKVIPNESGSGDIRAYPEFVRLLTDEAAAGSEIVLHGYTHRVAGPLRGGGLTRLRARAFAGAAAEFLSLDDQETAERLIAGRQVLRAVGLDPRGFCAPGWLASPRLPRVLRRCGFRYDITMLTVRDVATGRRLLTPWCGYMGADPLQERLIRLGGRACLALAPVAPAVKLFLHPQGARDSADCARALRLLARLLRTRRPVTFASLVGACA